MRKPNAVKQLSVAKRSAVDAPKPKFIMPLPDPAYWGAISIGTDHIGATTSSEKKHAADRQRATVVSGSRRTCSHNRPKLKPRISAPSPARVGMTSALSSISIRVAAIVRKQRFSTAKRNGQIHALEVKGMSTNGMTKS
jgi:hypothetical protein